MLTTCSSTKTLSEYTFSTHMHRVSPTSSLFPFVEMRNPTAAEGARQARCNNRLWALAHIDVGAGRRDGC
eukprot:7049450-Lingulodinium_polyedra.AAC.1